MKILIITVAGMSTRFSESVGHDVIKTIYYEKDFSECILYKIIHQPVNFDKYIIVGGYRYHELMEAVTKYFPEFADKIDLVENPRYKDFGSGYSLYCGLKRALEYDASDIVFAEGDLFFDSVSYAKVCNCADSVVTYNTEPILSQKAVAFYYSVEYEIHYIYDTGHKALEIKEPFLAIYNSGQVWKFAEVEKAREIFTRLTPADWEGTNLVFVQSYFNYVAKDRVSIQKFDKWINCNTIQDFLRLSRSERI